MQYTRSFLSQTSTSNYILTKIILPQIVCIICHENWYFKVDIWRGAQNPHRSYLKKRLNKTCKIKTRARSALNSKIDPSIKSVTKFSLTNLHCVRDCIFIVTYRYIAIHCHCTVHVVSLSTFYTLSVIH